MGPAIFFFLAFFVHLGMLSLRAIVKVLPFMRETNDLMNIFIIYTFFNRVLWAIRGNSEYIPLSSWIVDSMPCQRFQDSCLYRLNCHFLSLQ